MPLRKPKVKTITLPLRSLPAQAADKASDGPDILSDYNIEEDVEDASAATPPHSGKEKKISEAGADEPSVEQGLSPESPGEEALSEDFFEEENLVEEEWEEISFEADAEAEIARISEEAVSAQPRREEPEEIAAPSQKAPAARIPLPMRKPSKAERRRAARAAAEVRKETRAKSRSSQSGKLPQAGRSKTQEQQCAALQVCRTAFSKCRFSKKREETDEEGWEIHKKKCGAVYNKCIKQHFGQGEMFFTRWFLPFDPCS